MKTSFAYTTMLGIILGSMGYIGHRVQQSNEQYKLFAEKAKTEIKAKDYKRYINCLENVDRSELSGINRYDFWLHQNKLMNDSINNLKLDSLAAESAYAKWVKPVESLPCKSLKTAKKSLKLVR